MRNSSLFLKFLMDFIGSLVGLLVLSPLLIGIALSIKFTSRGPVFFRQDRLGRNGKSFKIIKFRTMVVQQEVEGVYSFVDSIDDPRITKVGKVLRATSLDELPQLFNVLMGEMSLIGPRPPVLRHPYEYKDYSDYQRQRFLMKPGITGLTQVIVRNSVTWQERILMDVKYIERFTIWLDIKILFVTLQRVIKPENIYTPSDKKGVKIEIE
ncbi:sugar transferase [Sporosarcina aquimarina]|uniref:Sugar transferase n=1 Tax=Sporosarcina aquimarina TaxID=114975 RepID=A0ABU4G144_9BACL|nr:sugar transferase [Sporosarcina aquimarina]MDW0110671.1 sugar transferase [Sporosarcina aquimarina]